MMTLNVLWESGRRRVSYALRDMAFEDIIFKLWPYFERAGIVASVILTVWLMDVRRSLHAARAELKEWQLRHDEAQSARIADNRETLPLIEKNTAETKTLIDLVRTLISMMTSRGGSRGGS